MCIRDVQVFRESIKAAITYKENSSDFLDQVMRELEVRTYIVEHHCTALRIHTSTVPQYSCRHDTLATL